MLCYIFSVYILLGNPGFALLSICSPEYAGLSHDFSYDNFKDYSKQNKVTLSRVLLELAQKSLDIWKDENR